MKQLILLFVLGSLAFGLQAQQRPADLKSPEYYLAKSRKQKTAAWLLLGSGIAATTYGAVAFTYHSFIETLPPLDENRTRVDALIALTGVVAIIGSTPLFNSARKNRRLGEIDIYMERLPITGSASRPAGPLMPRLRLSIDL